MFSVMIATTRGAAPMEWRLLTVRDTYAEAEQVVRDQRWIDSRPPVQHYRYRIVDESKSNN